MTQDLISYLQESRFNVKIYAEYFVMFNKWELEEASPSVFSAVSEPLRVLVPAPPGACTSWFGSPLQALRPPASTLFSTQGHGPPLRLHVPNWIS